MENKLTLENIAPFGKGLMYKDKYFMYEIDMLSFDLYDERGVFLKIISETLIASVWQNTTECAKPVLRKMDLTKSITAEGKEIIPIVELAKIAFPNINFNKKKVSYKIGADELPICPDVWISIDDEYGNVHKLSFNEAFKCFKIDNQYDNYRQLKLFKWLYKHKFDIDGLIDAGLAIDADSLETNPYNT